MPTPTACSACSGSPLVPHLRTSPVQHGDGFVPSTKQFGRALSDIVRCPACGHMQLDEMPDEVVLGEAYGAAADDEYVGEELGQRETAARVLARVERHVRPGRLLDLGCWVGFLLLESTVRGWVATGVEPSDWASTHARGQLGLDVRNGDLLTVELPEGGFDAVVLADVLEHLPEPGEALDRVARLLAPGGVLVLVLPDAGSRLARLLGAGWWSVIPTHVQYFTRASLRTLLAGRGWQVLETATAPKAFSVGYYLDRVHGYSPALARALTGAARAVRQHDRVVAPDFRDRMLVLANRPDYADP